LSLITKITHGAYALSSRNAAEIMPKLLLFLHLSMEIGGVAALLHLSMARGRTEKAEEEREPSWTNPLSTPAKQGSKTAHNGHRGLVAWFSLV
jgi:hypothetical protein